MSKPNSKVGGRRQKGGSTSHPSVGIQSQIPIVILRDSNTDLNRVFEVSQVQRLPVVGIISASLNLKSKG